jgi:hypothetical protein
VSDNSETTYIVRVTGGPSEVTTATAIRHAVRRLGVYDVTVVEQPPVAFTGSVSTVVQLEDCLLVEVLSDDVDDELTGKVVAYRDVP